MNEPPIDYKSNNALLLGQWQKDKSDKLRNKIITSNLNLVRKLAKKFYINRISDSYIDLVQEGCLGLIKALDKFDFERGVEFDNYAAWWIRAYMFKYVLTNWSLIKFASSTKDSKLFWKMIKMQNADLPIEEIAQKLGQKPEQIVGYLEKINTKFVDLHSSRSNKGLLIENINPQKDLMVPLASKEPDSLFFQKESVKLLEQFSKSLNYKQKYVFDKRILDDEPQTQEEIGKDLGVSKQRIQQLELKIQLAWEKFLKRKRVEL